MEDCNHDNRAYQMGGMTLTCNPPIHISKWICKDCGFEGEDRTQSVFHDEYSETMSKFGKQSDITYTN